MYIHLLNCVMCDHESYCSFHKLQSSSYIPVVIDYNCDGGLLVGRRTSVSQIRGSIPGQVAAV